MHYIYVAGPYTIGNSVVHTRNMIMAADEMVAKGYVPFVPLLNMFWELVSPHDEDYWMDWDLAWLDNCDSLVRLPGESRGADREVERAKWLGIPVYFGVEEVPCLT